MSDISGFGGPNQFDQVRQMYEESTTNDQVNEEATSSPTNMTGYPDGDEALRQAIEATDSEETTSSPPHSVKDTLLEGNNVIDQVVLDTSNQDTESVQQNSEQSVASRASESVLGVREAAEQALIDAHNEDTESVQEPQSKEDALRERLMSQLEQQQNILHR